MARSPYSPPTAPVSDPPEAEHPFAKPKHVRVAVFLLWTLVVLGIPSGYYEYERTSSVGEAVFLLFFFAILLALAAALNIYISKGRNWARMTYLIIVALSFLSYFLPDDSARVTSEVESALNVLSLILDVVVVYLLFAWPGALWFRPRT